MLRRTVVALLLGLTCTSLAQAAELTVSAAASLTNALTDAGKAFEKAHPEHKIVFNFAASGQLFQQIQQGAPVDVFISADQETMNKAAERGLLMTTSRRDLVGNGLVLISAANSPIKVTELQQLTDPAVKHIAIGKPETGPTGRYGKAALEKAGLWSKVEDKFVFADNVRQGVSYVVRGEAEAGFAFSTDAALEKDKLGAITSIALDKPIFYPAAIIKASTQNELASEFLLFLNGPGMTILEHYGFTKP